MRDLDDKAVGRSRPVPCFHVVSDTFRRAIQNPVSGTHRRIVTQLAQRHVPAPRKGRQLHRMPLHHARRRQLGHRRIEIVGGQIVP